MKLIMALIGLLTILGGLLPFLKDQGWLPQAVANVPTTGWGYQLIIIGIGVVAFLFAIKKSRDEA